MISISLNSIDNWLWGHGSLEEKPTFLKIPKKSGLANFFFYICSCQNEIPSKFSKGPFWENAGKLFLVKSTKNWWKLITLIWKKAIFEGYKTVFGAMVLLNFLDPYINSSFPPIFRSQRVKIYSIWKNKTSWKFRPL